MNPLKLIGQILQKPQSIAYGTFGAIDPLFDKVTKKRLEENFGREFSRSDVLKKGITGSLSPSDFWDKDARTSLPGQVNAVATNAAMDPMNLLGPAVKGLAAGTKLGKLASAAGTFGSLGDDATRAERAAQIARRFYQGSMASGGDATYGLAYAAGGGAAEKLLQNAFAKAASKMGSKAASQMVGEGVEQALSTPAVDRLKSMSTEEAMRIAAVPHIQPTSSSYAAGMREAADTADSALDTVTGIKGFQPSSAAVEKWRPGNAPELSNDPVVSRAREYLRSGNAGTTQSALMADVPGVTTKNVSNVLGALEREGTLGPAMGGSRFRDLVNIDRTRVPYSDRGAMFNDELMQRGMPVVNAPEQLALNPAPVPRPSPATLSTAVEPYRGELPPLQQNDVYMGSGAWPITNPAQSPALNAAPEPIPMGKVPSKELVPVGPRVPPTIQGVNRVPDNLVMPPMDIQNPVFANAGRQALESTTDPMVRQALEYLKTVPNVSQQQLANDLGVSRAVSAQLLAQLRGPQRAVGPVVRGRPSASLLYQEPAPQEDELFKLLLQATGG